MVETEAVRWLTICCYGFLYMSVALLWLPYKPRIPVWCITFSLSLVCGLANKQIEWYAMFPVITLVYALYYIERKDVATSRRVLGGIVVIFLSYGLGAHIFPYFYNVKVLSNVYVSEDGIPFTMYLNYDKAIVGLFILGFTQRLLMNKKEWINMFKKTIPMAMQCAVVLIFLALLVGKVHFDPKWPEYVVIWLLNNLLFVCIAEEGFFRGFIQKNLALIFVKFKWGNWLAVFIASLIFGFAHYAGGLNYSIWGFIAGLGYGLIYQRTNQIESSILAHFALNAIHFLFYTYPALR